MCAITQKVSPLRLRHTYSPFWADQIYVAGCVFFSSSWPAQETSVPTSAVDTTGSSGSPDLWPLLWLLCIPANVLNPLALEALVCAPHIPSHIIAATTLVCRFMTNVFVYPNIILLWLMCFLSPTRPTACSGFLQFFPFFVCIGRLSYTFYMPYVCI